MSKDIFSFISDSRQKNKKLLAVLIDPDKVDLPIVKMLVEKGVEAAVDLFFVGGSLVTENNMKQVIAYVKELCDIPVVLFPGSPIQLTEAADALLFLSLISGRNPDLLIGKHVTAAPLLKNMDIEVIPTAYMLIDGGQPTTASYISNTFPIPHNKPSIAACTALAGEFLGLKLLYMDSGSGAKRSVSLQMIRAVKDQVNLPIIIGGGIREPEQAYEVCRAGADLVVIGTAIEEDSDMIFKMAKAVHSNMESLKME